MKKLALWVGLLVLAALPACAQQPEEEEAEYPKLELFTGFNYGNLGLPILGRENTSGWQSSLSFNVHKNLGLVADFGGQYGDFRTLVGRFSYNTFDLLGGPRFTRRGERHNQFVHTLVGFSDNSIPGLGGTSFALGFGGGWDWNMGENSAMRIVQFDYIPTREAGAWRHNIRVGFGFVIRITAGGD